ncbi:hypothetical protein I6I20_02900 [Lactococcus garvieae]|nr:hypothetical protein I6I20_10110 [Lactococcus garvieae]QQC73729.1 hypothetical protein I6I20_02900 [Lactococcus garvieae]
MKIRVEVTLDTDTNKLSVEQKEVFDFNDYTENEKLKVHDIPDSVAKKLLTKALKMYE